MSHSIVSQGKCACGWEVGDDPEPCPLAKVRTYKDPYTSVRYVAKGHKAPKSFLYPTTCGHCGRTWEDGVSTGVTPTPAGRCPFEHMHHYGRTT